jgi:hypothetical protein
MPQLNVFHSELSIFVMLISLDTEYRTCPLRSSREKIDSLEKGSCIMKGRVGPVFNLSGQYNGY